MRLKTMGIHLREIVESNLGDCESLKRESNKYVGGPMWVIAQAYVHCYNSVAYGIYNEDTMIGMVILIEFRNKYSFSDFFIADYQNQGYAKQAVDRIIEKFKIEKKISNITIYVHESNIVDLHIYPILVILLHHIFQ